MSELEQVGLVAIGRNEGDRLRQCLESVVGTVPHIVYVDSGSTDDSVKMAESLGVEVVKLDMSIPFTAARARNAGFARLMDIAPNVEYVQFVDGDCEIVQGWLASAFDTFVANERVVAVCGWRRERHLEASIFNRICNVEWNSGAVGETLAFGGDVMIRTTAFRQVNGYDPSVIAAEDDELGVRLRQQGGTLLRIDQVSTLHDANMHSFGQWWKRAKRCGYAYAQVSHLHGAPPERKFVKQIRRTCLWGMILPLGTVALAVPTHGISLIMLMRYPVTVLRVILSSHRQGFSWLDSILWGVSCTGASFPEVTGVLQFYATRWQGKQHRIIEYK